MTTSDILPPNNGIQLSPTFHVINENSDADIDDINNFAASLSQANLSRFNVHNGSYPNISYKKLTPFNTLQNQYSAPPIYGIPSSPNHKGSDSNHFKNILSNSSVQSAFSTISDQSFVDDFHSITEELENIDNIVQNKVKSGSMTSIFSDLETSPKDTGQSQINSNNGKQFEVLRKDTNDNHIKNNISSYNDQSESNNTQKISYCSSMTSEANSLQSDLFQIQDIENQIGDL